MDEAKRNDGLKYIGDGTAMIGVPARDLTAAEASLYGRIALLASGLYMEYQAYMPKPTKSALKGKHADNKENTK